MVLQSGMGRINCVDTSSSEECFLVNPTPATGQEQSNHWNLTVERLNSPREKFILSFHANVDQDKEYSETLIEDDYSLILPNTSSQAVISTAETCRLEVMNFNPTNLMQSLDVTGYFYIERSNRNIDSYFQFETETWQEKQQFCWNRIWNDVQLGKMP